MQITPKPLQIEVYCRDCGTYLEAKWDNSNESPEIAVEPCQCTLNEIKKVHERFKHLDKLLCDTEWHTDSMPFSIASELWQAIKAVCEPDTEPPDASPTETSTDRGRSVL